jgi:DNA-binding transcriptional MocR family regulator
MAMTAQDLAQSLDCSVGQVEAAIERLKARGLIAENKEGKDQPIPPINPTHAIQFRDNWDGEGDIVHIFAFKVGDVWHEWESGKPLIEFEGDEILSVWELVAERQ